MFQTGQAAYGAAPSHSAGWGRQPKGELGGENTVKALKHAERLKNVVLETDRRRARKSLLPSSSRRADRVTGSGLGGRGGRGPGLGGSRLSREEADQSRPAKGGVAELPGAFACVRGRMNVCPGRLGGSLCSEGDGARRAPSDSETPCSLKCVQASRACVGGAERRGASCSVGHGGEACPSPAAWQLSRNRNGRLPARLPARALSRARSFALEEPQKL